ncbi:MAG: hypothetical protein J7639_32930, partial [Paenibacillaceae bacterium]|nr:hypothetical protein [Paenibacillaceae bacterium]
MKRNMMASLLGILTTAALVASGCSKTPDNTSGQSASPPPGSGTAASTAPSATAKAPAQLSIGLASDMDYNNFAKKSDKTDWPALKELQKRTNVNITWKTYPASNVDTLMNTQLASGVDLPDLMFTSDKVKTDVLLQNGVTLDLMPLIKQYAPNMQALIKKYPEILAKHTLEDGRMFSFPRQIDSPDDNLPGVLLRQDWLTKLKLKEPVTVEEFTDVLRAFKTQDPNGNGKQDEVPLMAKQWTSIDFLKPSFGLYDSGNDNYFFPDANGKFQLQLARPEYKAFVTWANTLYKENLVDHKMFEPGNQNDAVVALLNTNNLGGLVWNQNAVRKGFSSTTYLKKQDPNAELVVVNMPKSTFVDKVQVPRKYVVNSQAIITKNIKDPVAAIKFMDYGFGEEGSLLANWGIEGDSFTVKDGKKQLTDKVAGGSDPSWYLPEAYGIHRWLAVYDFAFYQQVNSWEQIDYDSNDKMKKIATAPLFPILPYSNDERDLYNKLRPDITTFGDENILKFITGARPLS